MTAGDECPRRVNDPAAGISEQQHSDFSVPGVSVLSQVDVVLAVRERTLAPPAVPRAETRCETLRALAADHARLRDLLALWQYPEPPLHRRQLIGQRRVVPRQKCYGWSRPAHCREAKP